MYQIAEYDVCGYHSLCHTNMSYMQVLQSSDASMAYGVEPPGAIALVSSLIGCVCK
jgi:hypothetical protein